MTSTISYQSTEVAQAAASTHAERVAIGRVIGGLLNTADPDGAVTASVATWRTIEKVTSSVVKGRGVPYQVAYNLGTGEVTISDVDQTARLMVAAAGHGIVWTGPDFRSALKLALKGRKATDVLSVIVSGDSATVGALRVPVTDGRQVEIMPQKSAGPAVFSLTPGDFSELCAAVLGATADDGTNYSRPVLTCAEIRVGADAVTMRGTDSYRLHAATRGARVIQPGRTLLVPAAALRTASKVTAAGYQICADDKAVTIYGWGDDGADVCWVTTRIDQGTYPDLDHVIPAYDGGTFTSVDSAQLLAALGEATSAVGKTSTPVRLTCDGEILSLVVSGDVVGSWSVPCSGDAFDLVAFNPGYLFAAVSACNASRVTLAMIGAGKPARLTDHCHGADRQAAYLMPVRVA